MLVEGYFMNVIDRIHELREQRNWSVYTLALEAGLTQSTLASMLQRNTPPKIDTLQCLCDAFGITLAQFFLENEKIDVLSAKEKELLNAYRKLPDKKRQALFDLIDN